MELFFQMTEITAEEVKIVKCSCINAIRERESASQTGLGVKQILLAQCYNLQKICLHQFKTHI